MRRAASAAWTLATGLLVTIAGLALQLNLLIVLVIALFAAGGAFYLLDYRARPDRRIFLNVTPAELMSLYGDRTHVQAEKAAKIYIGKWLRVSGIIRDVHSQALGTRTVFLEGRNQPFLIFRKNLAQIDILQKGEPIEVIGKVSGISAYNLFLHRCELVSVGEAVTPASPTPSASPPS